MVEVVDTEEVVVFALVVVVFLVVEVVISSIGFII